MTHITISWWSQNWHQMKVPFFSNVSSHDLIRSQFCTCHDSSAVMTCAKLWPDEINIFHVGAMHILTRFGLWAHNPIAIWVYVHISRDDSRSVPSQWETALLCNDVSHGLDASLESTLYIYKVPCVHLSLSICFAHTVIPYPNIWHKTQMCITASYGVKPSCRIIWSALHG